MIERTRGNLFGFTLHHWHGDQQYCVTSELSRRNQQQKQQTSLRYKDTMQRLCCSVCAKKGQRMTYWRLRTTHHKTPMSVSLADLRVSTLALRLPTANFSNNGETHHHISHT
ncbi:unnamed protein product [Effrenium voratum]|uniref:Uncharacterized protein n=1 Tax=Effrenium voratum TaxID=2562239 RepID=A0AA36JGD7_9DINO|nr:unnamed protein product [Effrenium voratum]